MVEREGLGLSCAVPLSVRQGVAEWRYLVASMQIMCVMLAVPCVAVPNNKSVQVGHPACGDSACSTAIPRVLLFVALCEPCSLIALVDLCRLAWLE